MGQIFAGFARAWYRCRKVRSFPQLGKEVHWVRQTEEVEQFLDLLVREGKAGWQVTPFKLPPSFYRLLTR